MTRLTPGTVVEVAIPLPLPGLFSYVLPADMRAAARPGSRLRVPFGPRKLVGYLVRESLGKSTEGLKTVLALIDDEPLIGAQFLDLAIRMARRYAAGPGEVLAAFLPAAVKKGARGRRTILVRAVPVAAARALADLGDSDRLTARRAVLQALLDAEDGLPRTLLERRLGISSSPMKTLERAGLITFEEVEEREDLFARLDIRPTHAPSLMSDQVQAASAIGRAIEDSRYAGFLLHGVTGSGKTEVYLDAIGRCVAKGRGAIILVPEIALTPQTVERFESRFGSVAVLHSRLTDSERAAQWEEIRRGTKRIAIGPRSAVFAPVDPLGLIVLDEEHEYTFKQQNAPRYHARDVALMRAQSQDAVVVFGSATPSLESWDAARRGALVKLSMPRRVAERPLPEVSIIDMRVQRPTGPGGVFSPVLASLIGQALDRREQVLLFLNRRGFHTTLLCRGCGAAVECRDCDIAMTWYKSTGQLLCHYCGRSTRPPSTCPECGSPTIRFSGFGTEMIEHAAQKFFPSARVARMDGRSMAAKHAHEDLFAKLKAGEVDILVGTQMAAKGLDFPGITLIGVVAADTSLLIPDFRAAERTFQLVCQVAGRAGRGAKPGRVIVQTFTPDHYAYTRAAAHDYEGFAEDELAFRLEARYPPFGALARAVFQGDDEQKVLAKANQCANALRPAAASLGISLLGPSPCPLARIKRLFRHHLVLRADDGDALEQLMADQERVLRSGSRVQVLVDRDPTTMM